MANDTIFGALSGMSIILMLLAFFFVIILLLWMFCLVDLSEWGIAASPICSIDGGGGDGDGGDEDDLEEQPEPSDCPPLDSKLMGSIPALIVAGRNACQAGGGTYYTTDNIVGCVGYPVPVLDCWDMANNPANVNHVNYENFQDACYDAGGSVRCSPNDLYCYCPGNEPFPEHDCGYAYDTSGGWDCEGTCHDAPPGADCEEYWNQLDNKKVCGCAFMCGEKFTNFDPMTCYGVCPNQHEVCVTFADPGQPGAPLPNVCRCESVPI